MKGIIKPTITKLDEVKSRRLDRPLTSCNVKEFPLEVWHRFAAMAKMRGLKIPQAMEAALNKWIRDCEAEMKGSYNYGKD